MINRDWFCLALRLFGIWLLVQAVESFVPYLVFFLNGNLASPSFAYVVPMVLWFIGRTAIALVLLFFAPAIATRFYPKRATAEKPRLEAFDEEAKPLKVGMQLLGVYALLLAVQSGAGIILGLLSGANFGIASGTSLNGVDTGDLLTGGLNLAFAAILIIWNERVVTLIAKFRYVPERDAYEPPPVDE